MNVIGCSTFLKTLAEFNISKFAGLMARFLFSKGATYVTEANALDVFKFTVCEVDRNLFGYADMRDTVCPGMPGVCAAGVSLDKRCPQGVVRCNCPATSKASLWRLLLQVGSNFTSAKVEVQVEMSVLLERAVAFKGTSTAIIAEEISRLNNFIIQGVTSGAEFASYQIQTDLVTNTTAGAPLLEPPPTLPVTPEPVTASPTPTPWDLPAAAAAVSVVWATLALVMAVLAM